MTHRINESCECHLILKAIKAPLSSPFFFIVATPTTSLPTFSLFHYLNPNMVLKQAVCNIEPQC